MKKAFTFMLVFMLASTSFAKKNPLVGVWQQVRQVENGFVTLGPGGKVFLPDGRLFGYSLYPSDFEHYEEYNFEPWLFADYEVTSDSTYTEQISLHNDKGWETTLNFTYKLLNSRTLYAFYEHTNSDGTKQVIHDLWIKAVYDKKTEKMIFKKVDANWNEYFEKAKKQYGRE